MALFSNLRSTVLGPIFGKFVSPRGAANKRDRLFLTEEQAAHENVLAHVEQGDLVRLDPPEPQVLAAAPDEDPVPLDSVSTPAEPPALEGGSVPEDDSKDAGDAGESEDDSGDGSDAGEGAEVIADLSKLKVADLRALATAKGLSAEGTKAEIAARLSEAGFGGK